MTDQSTANDAASIWDELNKRTQEVNNDQLSIQEAQAIWAEGATFIDRKAKMLIHASDLRGKINEQIRARPHELELNQMRVELDSATPRISPGATYEQQVQQLEIFFHMVEHISQRYEEHSANCLPIPVPDDDVPVTKRHVIKMMADAGWEGNVTAFLGQASVDVEIQECQGPEGRNWIAKKVYDLGLRRGKLQPKAYQRHQLLANNPWGTR
jgi:hypothetical protein